MSETAHPSPDPEVLEQATINQIIALDDGGFGLLQEMYDLFRDDFKGRMDAIEHALKSGNLDELGDVAHAVKGAASTMGAPKVRAVAAALELAARKGVQDTPWEELHRQLKVYYQESLDALKTFLAG